MNDTKFLSRFFLVIISKLALIQLGSNNGNNNYETDICLNFSLTYVAPTVENLFKSLPFHLSLFTVAKK